MNINNINSEVAVMESPPIEAPASRKATVVEPVPKAQDLKMQQEQSKKEEGLSAEITKEITTDLNEYMNSLQTNLRFSMYEKLDHQVVVEIKNKETDELIKQIPSEALLELRVKMEELSGLLFDEVI